MWHRRDRLMPLAAFGALAAVAALLLVLLTSAVNSGREALEDSLVNEVNALAASQSQSLASQIGTINSFLAGRDLTFEVGSEEDRAEFADVAGLLEDAQIRTGFFFTDDEGVVTLGFHLQDESVVGEPLERPGFEAVLQQLSAELPAAWLPVAPGLTTEVPTFALVAGIFEDEQGGPLEGTLVFESDVVPESGLSQQLGQLGHGETGEYLIYDQSGTIVAATDPSLVAEQVPDQSYLAGAAGLDRRDGEVRVLADIPVAQWRVAFRQDVDEFEEGLSGPLQRAGGIVVAAFLLLGAAVFVALTRRLRAAREEQERLRRLAESQEEFISIVSHELRTPVAGVLGFLQTTIDHWGSMTEGERSGAVLRAASNARRLQGLTRDVLDSQSVESGRMTYAMSDSNLQEELAVALDAARALYPAQRFEARYEVEDAPVHMDVDRIQQVLTNLVDNAVRVSPPDEPIELRLWTEDGRAKISVHDHGPGLPVGTEDRVFEKFVRGRGPTVSGTGLGLYIARQILDAHGGSISVDSPPGEGATFVVELPLSEVAAVPD